MHRLPLRRREVGELNALTRDNRGCGECEIENTPSAELLNANTIDHSDKVLSSPTPSPSFRASFERGTLYSIGPRPLAATFSPLPQNAYFASFFAQRRSGESTRTYVRAIVRIRARRRARYVDLLSRMGPRKQSRTTITYALLIFYATLTVCHCCYVFPKGTQTRIITRLE